jgi:hypothetical protein
MPDCFISYASADVAFAKAIYDELTAHGVETFMAAVSLRPGVRWGNEIQEALSASKWVLFLASRAACASAYVQQEIGQALDGTRTLIPVVWDMEPRELPGWVNQFQALNIAGMTPLETREQILAIGARIKASKSQGAWIAVALLTALVLVGTSKSGAPAA